MKNNNKRLAMVLILLTILSLTACTNSIDVSLSDHTEKEHYDSVTHIPEYTGEPTWKSMEMNPILPHQN